MIDVRTLRDDPEYRRGILRKGTDPSLLDAVLAADDERRRVRLEVEELRARHNAVSKQISRTSAGERQALVDDAARLKEELGRKEPQLAEAEARFRQLVVHVPNPAAADVPDGGEADAEVLKVVGETTPPPPLDHHEYGLAMGFVEQEQAAQASGSRFHYLMREAVLLEFALARWTLGRLLEHGFVPVVPPVLVREEVMEEAGFFPTDRHQVYEVDGGELFLVGTSEVPLSALHADETFASEDDLPARYGGFSSCFRREAGTYGKDTRGIFRVHQFDKVEMFSYAHPDRSEAEHEVLVAIQESIVADLGLPYRVVNVAAGDLGAPAAKKVDLEVWLPSEQRYRELTSCSNYRDYSARRLGTRVRTAEGGLRFVHTLNGTACAVGRTLVFLFEHYQQEDGSLVVPDVLRPHCGLDRIPSRS